MIFFALSLGEVLGEIADVRRDEIVLSLEAERACRNACAFPSQAPAGRPPQRPAVSRGQPQRG
jgi:hypothetical protein